MMFWKSNLWETLERKLKRYCRQEALLAGSRQDSSCRAEVLSSMLDSVCALSRASWSSEGNRGSGSSLQNCLMRVAKSYGSAVDRHDSPLFSLFWNKTQEVKTKSSHIRVSLSVTPHSAVGLIIIMMT